MTQSDKQNGITNSSHTTKALGSHVTFVERYSAAKVTLSDTCCDMKMWSRVFAINVQSVFIQHLNWNSISQFTLTTDSFAVFFVMRRSNVNAQLSSTSRNVLLQTGVTLLISWFKDDENSLLTHCVSILSARFHLYYAYCYSAKRKSVFHTGWGGQVNMNA